MPFPAFWGEILCMERVRNEEKMNETRPSLMTIQYHKCNFTENLTYYNLPYKFMPCVILCILSKEM